MLIQNKKTNYLAIYKETIMSFLVIIFCLFLIYYFPSANAVQKYTSALFFFFIIPALYIKFILRKNLSDFGFNLENRKDGLIWGTGMFFASLLAGYLIINYTDALSSYRIPSAAIANFWIFIFYEFILVNILLFFQSFFFLGFVMFSLSARLRWQAIAAPVLFFLILLFLSGNFGWKFFPTVIVLSLGGAVSYKTNSFLYAYIAGLLTMFFLDAYLVYMLK